MKKILSYTFCLLLIGAGLLYYRVSQNPTSIIPFPYKLSKELVEKIQVDAPILIIGDKMGQRLAQFKSLLAEKISINLTKSIKIVDLTEDGMNIHRTLAKIKQLKRLPLIIIYLGGIQENNEQLFSFKEYNKIKENFEKFKDDRIRTLLMIFPDFSRLIYTPHKRIYLNREIIPFKKNELADNIIQKNLMLNYQLYEAAAEELMSLITKASSLFIPITAPINLINPPKKSCYGTLSGDSDQQYKKLIKVYKSKDLKQAYKISNELVLLNPHNADINFMHSKVLQGLQQHSKAQQFAENAKIYDCQNSSGNKIFNTILKRTAKKNKVQYLDFHQMIYDKSKNEPVFLDEIFPQDVYFEQIADKLSKVIKKRLRL